MTVPEGRAVTSRDKDRVATAFVAAWLRKPQRSFSQTYKRIDKGRQLEDDKFCREANEYGHD